MSIVVVIFLIDEIIVTYAQELGLCIPSGTTRYCHINEIIPLNNEYVAFMMIGLLVTTIFTFFISDKIFKKWLIFTIVYFIVTAVLVYLSPTTMQGPLVGPTKELVSMNMSWIFVGISLIMFIWMSVREKK